METRNSLFTHNAIKIVGSRWQLNTSVGDDGLLLLGRLGGVVTQTLAERILARWTTGTLLLTALAHWGTRGDARAAMVAAMVASRVRRAIESAADEVLVGGTTLRVVGVASSASVACAAARHDCGLFKVRLSGVASEVN